MVRLFHLLRINAVTSGVAAALAPMRERRSAFRRLTPTETSSLLQMAEAVRRVEDDEVGKQGEPRALVTVSDIGRR